MKHLRTLIISFLFLSLSFMVLPIAEAKPNTITVVVKNYSNKPIADCNLELWYISSNLIQFVESGVTNDRGKCVFSTSEIFPNQIYEIRIGYRIYQFTTNRKGSINLNIYLNN